MSASAADTVTLRPGGSVPLGLTVLLRKAREGPELQRFELTQADLCDVQAEVWLDTVLRRGFPDVTLEETTMRFHAEFREDGTRCNGFVFEVMTPDGRVRRREYTIDIFRETAMERAKELIATGSVENRSVIYFEIRAHHRPDRIAPATTDAPVLSVETKRAPLAYLKTSLGALCREARVEGEFDETAFRVLYTEGALSKAEGFARKGAEAHPPIETGAVLVGWPCSCPETGEFFLVVGDALEATDAEESKFSLSYTSRTWSRIQSVMKARQRRRGAEAMRLLGQAHGHNFVPGEPCEACATAKVCGRTSVFVSTDDRNWSRAVFHGQPWQLCHIFGLNARRERVQGLYSLRGNRLTERGFHVIPGFDPLAVGK